jgi:hypothetical protein
VQEVKEFVAFVSSQRKRKSDAWYFSSRASKHMTNRVDLLVEFVQHYSRLDTVIWGIDRSTICGRKWQHVA